MTKIKYKDNFEYTDASHKLNTLDKEATVHISTSSVIQNRCKKQGKLCHVNVTWSNYAPNAASSVAIITLPEEFRPKEHKVLEGGICKLPSESFSRSLTVNVNTAGQITQSVTSGNVDIKCIDLVYILDE